MGTGLFYTFFCPPVSSRLAVSARATHPIPELNSPRFAIRYPTRERRAEDVNAREIRQRKPSAAHEVICALREPPSFGSGGIAGERGKL